MSDLLHKNVYRPENMSATYYPINTFSEIVYRTNNP